MVNPYDDNTYRVLILSHVDGDTTRVRVDPGFDIDGLRLTIRWHGIDAPEISTPEGDAALVFLNEQLPPGTRCLMRSVKDRREKYGRYLGVFFKDGVNLNDLMVSAHHAVRYDGGKREETA